MALCLEKQCTYLCLKNSPLQRVDKMAEVERKKKEVHLLQLGLQPAAGHVLRTVDAAAQCLSAAEVELGCAEETVLTAEAPA